MKVIKEYKKEEESDALEFKVDIVVFQHM